MFGVSTLQYSILSTKICSQCNTPIAQRIEWLFPKQYVEGSNPSGSAEGDSESTSLHRRFPSMIGCPQLCPWGASVGPVAPIGRASLLHGECCGFESHPVHVSVETLP